MPKNKGKGGKGKRKGKRNKGGDAEKAELRFKVFGEEYAQVRRVLGNCRVEAYCFDGKVRLCHVRGKFKKRVWINKDDFVLVGLRDYQDDKSDIIHKYTTEEARLLRSWGEIPADKANFDDDGAISGGEEEAVFSEEEGEEGGAGDGSDSDSSEDELFQPNNNRNLPVGGEEEGSSEDSSEEESSEDEEENMFAAQKKGGGGGGGGGKQSTQNAQAILKSFRRNNSKNAKGRGGGRGGGRDEERDDKRGGNRGAGAPPSASKGQITNKGGPTYNRNNPRGNNNARQQNGRQGSIDDEIEGL